MAVILVPASGEDIMINWMTWRPTVALLVRAAILPTGEREERCLANGCGGHLSEAEALQAADYLETVVAKMQPGERLLSDGSTTSQPKDYTVPISEWDKNEMNNRYSADYKVLKEFAEFCRRSGGFDVL